MRRTFAALALVVTACSGASGETTSSTVSPTSTLASTTTTAMAATTTSTTLAVASEWHLAWQPTRLVPGFTEALQAIPGVDTVSMVRVGDANVVETRATNGSVIQQPVDGFVIPVEVHAFDPLAHGRFLPDELAGVFATMGNDEVMLGSTSAKIRGLRIGDTLTFQGGIDVTVAGIVPDQFVGDAEVITTRPDPEVFASFLDKYAVFWYDGSRADLESAVAGFDGEPVTVRQWGEVLVFRHGDSVRSQVAFKDRFGEFLIRPTGGGFEQEPAWREANIVTESVPLLGSVTCHRDFIELLTEAMTALEEAGRADAVDAAAFRGCWNARFIAGRQAISHHSFGAAADINFFNGLDGPASPVDPDLLAAMDAAGMTSGHIWVNPDPGHFEWFDG